MTTPVPVSQPIDPAATVTRPNRLLSVDLLRGLTMAFMIIVNDNGSDTGAYWALKHAHWNGCTPTDLVFPTFLFLVGVTTVFSTAGRLRRGDNKGSLILHVLRRSVILFLLGLVVNNFPFFHLATFRFYGVLPRIALCYLIVATFYILSPGWRSKVVALVGCLAGYWILMRFVPVPGYGVPGKDISLLDPNLNLVAWLDRHIFSAGHLYERVRDPEGLLSTLPAIGTTLIGLLTGLWLRTGNSLATKARGIVGAGVMGILLGGLWNLSFPINKKLWTSSYVLFAGGISLLLLALFLWVADVRRSRADYTGGKLIFIADTSLLVLGTNAIVAYELSELLAGTLGSVRVAPTVDLSHWLYLQLASAVPNVAFSSLLYSLAYLAVCWSVVYVFFYRRRIFVKI
jgi:predicted acyltransferase